MTEKLSLARAAPLFAVVVVVCHLALARACTPAVIWCPHESPDYDAVPSSPLQKLTSEEFESSLMQLNVTKPALVADELCVEDLRSNKVLSNTTSGSKIFYFPCVITPDLVYHKLYKQIRVIEDINDDHEFNVALKDIDSNGCIALTGKQCRYSYTERIKREVSTDNTTQVKIKTDKVILFSAKPFEFQANEKTGNVTLDRLKFSTASSHEEKEGVILSITFANVEYIGSVTLEFYFLNTSSGYYTLSKVVYDKLDLHSNRDITFPHTFSYHCSPTTAFINGSTYLNITEMQMQVNHKNATFNDAYDCVGFTSIPIWMGLFVTGILGLIMIWALIMIMDIRTMDRFDDPKGKTITISSAD
jgi:hypothetical protein